MSRGVSGAAVDRYESDRQRHTVVINLDTTRGRRVEEESRSMSATTAEYGQQVDEEDYEDYYDEEEYEDGMSGDYDELPRGKGVCHFSNSSHDFTLVLTKINIFLFSVFCLVAMVSKPKDPLAILETENPEGNRRRGKGKRKGKGKGKKRNPCLKKYKDFCIHGTCQYYRNIRAPSCV